MTTTATDSFAEQQVGSAVVMAWRSHFMSDLLHAAGFGVLALEPSVVSTETMRLSHELTDDGVMWAWDGWDRVTVACCRDDRETPLRTETITRPQAPSAPWRMLSDHHCDAFELVATSTAGQRVSATVRLPFPARRPRSNVTFDYLEEAHSAQVRIDATLPRDGLWPEVFELVANAARFRPRLSMPLATSNRLAIPRHLRGLIALVDRRADGMTRIVNAAAVEPGYGPLPTPLESEDWASLEALLRIASAPPRAWPERTHRLLRRIADSAGDRYPYGRDELAVQLNRDPVSTVRLMILRALGAPVSRPDGAMPEPSFEASLRARWPKVAEALPKARSLSETAWLFEQSNRADLAEIAECAAGTGRAGFDLASELLETRKGLVRYRGLARAGTRLRTDIEHALQKLDEGIKRGALPPAERDRLRAKLEKTQQLERAAVDVFGDPPELLPRYEEWVGGRQHLAEWRSRTACVLRFCESGHWSCVTTGDPSPTVDDSVTGFERVELADGVEPTRTCVKVDHALAELQSAFEWSAEPRYARLHALVQEKVVGRVPRWVAVHDRCEKARQLRVTFPRLAEHVGVDKEWEWQTLGVRTAAATRLVDIAVAAEACAADWARQTGMRLDGAPSLEQLTSPGHAAIAARIARANRLSARVSNGSPQLFCDTLLRPDEPTLEGYQAWWTAVLKLTVDVRRLEDASRNLDETVKAVMKLEELPRLSTEEETRAQVEAATRLDAVRNGTAGLETITRSDVKQLLHGTRATP